MKSYEYKAGVTLVEMLIVVAIIAILVSTVISIATRIDNRAKERLAENTIAILTAALEQFHDYGYQYQGPAYAAFDFPIDCNGLNYIDVQDVLEAALGMSPVSISILSVNDSHDPNYSGCEVMYFFLSRVPASRKTLEKIAPSLVTNKDVNGNRIQLEFYFPVQKFYPFLRVVDPWGKTLRYNYYYYFPGIAPDYDSRRSFPVITSAGPDRIFGTDDDISSR